MKLIAGLLRVIVLQIVGTRNIKVCDNHFTEEQFDSSPKWKLGYLRSRKLLPTAVPNFNLPMPFETEEQTAIRLANGK